RTSDRVAVRWYSMVSALGPSGSMGIFSLAATPPGGTGTLAQMVILVRQADGTIQVQRGNTREVVFTSAPLEAGVMYRFEVRVKYATASGASNGVEEFAIFAGDSPEPLPGC